MYPRVIYNIFLTFVLLVCVGVLWPGIAKRGSVFQFSYSIVTDGGGAIAATRTLEASHTEIGQANFAYAVTRDGLIFDRATNRLFRVDFSWNDPALAQRPNLEAQARAAVVSQLMAEGRGGLPEFSALRLTLSDFRTTKHHPLGYALDALVYLALTALLVGWILLLRNANRLDARDRRVSKQHACFNCGYDTRGLKSTVCPECGERL